LEGTGAEDDRLTGFNQIEKLGSGTWTLDTDFQAGSASDFYQTGDFRGTLAVDVVDAGGQLNLTGNITDNADGTKGQLVKNGVGTLALSGTNSYSGATTINGGTLQANGGNAIGDSSAVSVASGAALLVGGNETIGSLAGDGDVLLNGQTLQAGSDNSSTLFNGNISGTGQFGKIGSGTLTLAGNNTSTGVLTVEEGSLNAAGTIPMIVTVGPLGSLYGTGTLGQLVNTGSAAPGNSIGTLTVNNDYLQTAAGTLEIEIAPDGSAANDLLAVGGAANLDGTLSVKGENSTLLTPAVDGNIYTIVTAGGGVNGQFNAAPLLGAFAFSPTYNANDVQLGVTYAGFSAVQNSGTAPGTGTQNQKSKAKALDKPVVHPSGLSFNSGNSDFDQILLEIANETADELANTYNNIIAEPYAAYMTVLLEQNDFFAETVMDRAQVCSVSGRGSLGGDFTQQPDTADGNAPVGCGSTAGDRPHGAWVDATWVKGDVDGDDGLSGYDYRMTGLLAGVDTAFSSNFAGGLAVGYGQPELDSYDLADAEIDGDSYFLSTYGTFTRKNLEIAGLLGYTFGEYDGERRIRFGSIDRTAKGEFDGDGVIASAKAAYFYKVDNYDLVPELGLTYSKIWQDGFTEKGANSLNLKVDDADAYSVVTSAGMRIATVLQKGETRIRPHALLRYEYDWNAGNDEDHDLEATFAEVPIIGSIDVVGQNRGENGVVVSGGATVQITKKVDIFADGGYRWHDNGDEYTFSAGARMVW
jgi:autotransporter-associated beta strand protein